MGDYGGRRVCIFDILAFFGWNAKKVSLLGSLLSQIAMQAQPWLMARGNKAFKVDLEMV